MNVNDVFASLDGKICAQYNDQNCWNGSHTVSAYEARQNGQRQSSSSSSSMNGNYSNEMIITLHDRVKQSETTIQELLIHNQHSSRFSHTINDELDQVDDDTDHNDHQLDDGSGSGANPIYDDEDYNYQESSGHLPRLSNHHHHHDDGDMSGSTDDAVSDIVIDPIQVITKQHSDSSALRISMSIAMMAMLTILSLMISFSL
ncbi:hypothetical protein BLA29_002872 [Euroglyphus maynei]|uniref:Uncharacterized protein n=1 Tax=Euroglyphus maynei TaxID=6958 RepID=A0A1Y3BFG2_EURMA|nr:hypothetical protein BLA29_002872 [Euroglyphus maynei]